MNHNVCSYRSIKSNDDFLDERTPFLKDFGTIIYKSQFRRLSNKTQVFLNPEYDFPRTRLTHSIEVEQISREVSRYFAKKIQESFNFETDAEKSCFPGFFEDLVAAVSLSHDIGQAPFGHRGEKTLYNLMKDIKHIDKQDYFEANKQNVRLLLGNRSRKPYGVTCALLDSVMKYKSRSFEGKSKYPGYYSFEEKIISQIKRSTSKEYRNPACYIMEASDDMAYISSDFQDALKLSLIGIDNAISILEDIDLPTYKSDLEKSSWKEFFSVAFEKDNFEIITTLLIRVMLESVKKNIDYFVDNLSSGIHINDLPMLMDKFFSSDNCELNILYFGYGKQFRLVKDSIYNKHILANKEIARNELLAKKVIEDLWSIMEEQLICDKYSDSDFFKIIPEHVQNNIKLAHEDKEIFQKQKYQFLADYISGMTDQYAIYIWNQLFNPSSLKFS